ncbi:substrate-binding periplasmic protein [Microbacterium sp. KHB019]|uniref:substrate-binding periplasmic protein n=1 Tax=Microbacterium sp. KHB019 TaxID=3129770 RepID=UPI00307A61F0
MRRFTSARSTKGWRSGALVAGVAALALLTGCSVGSAPDGGNTDGGGGGDSSVKGSTWEDVQARGTINVGVGLTTPPYGSTDKSGKPAGYDVDVAQQLADYLGVEAHIFEVSADGRIPAIQSGKADVISFTLTHTPERAEQIDFSTDTMNTYQAAAVQKGSDITDVDQIADKVVAVQKGAISATVTPEAYPGVNMQQYDTAVAVRLAVQQGQADAAVDSVSVLQYAISSEADSNLQILPGVIGKKQAYGLGLQKGNTTLKEKVDEFLADFHAKGEGKKLYEKWFGQAPPEDVFAGLED